MEDINMLGSQNEMVGINGSNGSSAHAEILLRDQSQEIRSIGLVTGVGSVVACGLQVLKRRSRDSPNL